MGQITTEGSSSPESPNIVTLHLQSIDPNLMYCYSVTASNVSYTVIVMGMIGEWGCCVVLLTRVFVSSYMT